MKPTIMTPVLALTLLGMMTLPPGMISANTWVGTADSAWSNPGNWSLGRIPTNGDAVVIDSLSSTATNILLTNTTVRLDSLTLTNRTLTVSGWNTTLYASNVIIRQGGVLTLPSAFTDGGASNRIHIVCTNFALHGGGQINANGKGYAGCFQVAQGNGHGPGGGRISGGWASGGGHGGRGGYPSSQIPTKGAINGTPQTPNPGSGGGGGTQFGIGGNGGGSIIVDASNGTILVNGVISANGTAAAGYPSGGGSGGGIRLICGSISASSTGRIEVIGGNGGIPGNRKGGRGGGGRIVIAHNPIDQALAGLPEICLSVLGALDGASTQGVAEDGTIHLPNSQLLTRAIVGEKATIWGVTNWSSSSLTFTNCNWTLRGPRVRLLVTNTLTIGSNGQLGLYLEQSRLDCAHLVLTNGGRLAVYSGTTNDTTPDYGALISVTGTVWIGSNSWIHPYSDSMNGGSPRFVMHDLVLAGGSSGGIDATTGGYQVRKGPGAGITDGSFYGGGGAYGGCGGVGGNTSPRGGIPYGSANAPFSPGSGGGGDYMGVAPGIGGGFIWIEARGTVTANGVLRSNGGNFQVSGNGGGSGGGIWVLCSRFQGDATGILEAKGGNGNSNAGGGGGGRIAIWISVPSHRWEGIRNGTDSSLSPLPTYPRYTGAISVTNGAGLRSGPPYDGSWGAGAGTAVFLIGTSPGSVFCIQ